MTTSQIVATVTNDGTTAEQVEAVVSRLERALPVRQADDGIEVGQTDDGSPLMLVKVIAETMTVAVKGKHGETGLWVAAAIAATLKQDVVAVDGESLPANATTVSLLLGGCISEEGRSLAEKLRLVLPRIRGGSNWIKF